jgi:hypothetical protein
MYRHLWRTSLSSPLVSKGVRDTVDAQESERSSAPSLVLCVLVCPPRRDTAHRSPTLYYMSAMIETCRRNRMLNGDEGWVLEKETIAPPLGVQGS